MKNLATAGLIGLLSVCAGMNALAARNDAESTEATKESQSTDIGLACRRVKELGSRMAKKVCTTRAQREARGEQDRAMIYEAQQRAGANVGSSSQ